MPTATCQSTLHKTAPQRLPLVSRITKPRVRRAFPLDVEALPEHLRRDLGFADGRPAPPRNPLYD
jgi:hypothetical protein